MYILQYTYTYVYYVIYKYFDIGQSYYVNQFTKESQWEKPTKPAEPGSDDDKVQASHLLVKHKDDNRYDSEYIVTHDNQKYKAINTKYLKDIIENKNVVKSEVLCIDEIQFYEDASEICDLWANNGKIVIASGLNGDFKREPFEQISKLLPKACQLR